VNRDHVLFKVGAVLLVTEKPVDEVPLDIYKPLHCAKTCDFALEMANVYITKNSPEDP
jgi:hypothetical protein